MRICACRDADRGSGGVAHARLVGTSLVTWRHGLDVRRLVREVDAAVAACRALPFACMCVQRLPDTRRILVYRIHTGPSVILYTCDADASHVIVSGALSNPACHVSVTLTEVRDARSAPSWSWPSVSAPDPALVDMGDMSATPPPSACGVERLVRYWTLSGTACVDDRLVRTPTQSGLTRVRDPEPRLCLSLGWLDRVPDSIAPLRVTLERIQRADLNLLAETDADDPPAVTWLRRALVFRALLALGWLDPMCMSAPRGHLSLYVAAWTQGNRDIGMPAPHRNRF